MGESCGDGGECKWYLSVLGVLISCLASGTSAIANVGVRWSHVNEASRPKEEQRNTFKRCHIYPIFGLYILNGLLDMAAFSLAPMSLLAPTSALTIVINALAARIILGEVMTRVDFVGTSVIFTGAILCTVFGSKQSEQRSADELKELYNRRAFIDFSVMHGGLLVLCFVFSYIVFPRLLDVSGLLYTAQTDRQQENVVVVDLSSKEEKEAAQEEKKKQKKLEASALRKAHKWSYGFWGLGFALLTAGTAAWTNVLLKSVSEMLTTSFKGDNQLDDGTFWLLLSGMTASVLMQLVFMTSIFEPFESIFIVPMFQSSLIISLIVIGGMYFNEFSVMSTSEIAMFCTGCVVCLVGIAIIAGQGERQLAEDKGRLNKANEMLAVDSDTDNTSSQALKMDRANESKKKEPLTTGINVQQAAEDEP